MMPIHLSPYAGRKITLTKAQRIKYGLEAAAQKAVKK